MWANAAGERGHSPAAYLRASLMMYADSRSPKLTTSAEVRLESSFRQLTPWRYLLSSCSTREEVRPQGRPGLRLRRVPSLHLHPPPHSNRFVTARLCLQPLQKWAGVGGWVGGGGGSGPFSGPLGWLP